MPGRSPAHLRGGGGESLWPDLIGNKPLAFIGLISYSLYLWHWPIIAYLNYLAIPIDLATGVGVALLSIFLAWLSWKFVEVPLRKNGATLTFGRVFTLRFALPAVALATLTGAALHTQGFPQRFDPRVFAFEKYLNARPELLRAGCHVPSALYDTPYDPGKCKFGANKAAPEGILIGDSIANQYTGMLDVLAKAENVALADYTMDGCPPILDYKIHKSPGYVQKCLQRNQTAYTLAKITPWVILSGNWPDDAEAGRQLLASVEALIHAGARVTIIKKNATIEHANSCPIHNLMYHANNDCSMPQ